MSKIPRRIASAFAVLCGRYGDVTGLARERVQLRRVFYREAERVVDAVEGATAQSRIDDPRLGLGPDRPTDEGVSRLA